MLTVSKWTAIALCLGVATTSVAAAESSYTVRKGDSLSSIAAQTLNDAQRWREIWALNPQIRAPKELQPGTRLRLPAPPPSDTDTAISTLSPRPALDGVQLMAEALIRNGRIHAMQRDYQLLDARQAGTAARVQAVREEAETVRLYARGLPGTSVIGQRFALFRASADPASSELIELKRVGTAELLAHESDKGTLKLLQSQVSQEQLNQLWLLPLAEPRRPLQAHYPERPVQARIIKALYEQPGGYLLLLDQGRAAGLQPGHLLRFGKRELIQTDTGEVAQYPAREAGWMLVIEAEQSASLALVVQAHGVPAVDDPVF